MTTTPEAMATVLLKQQRDRQKIVDEFLGRSTWHRVATWLPGPMTVAVIVWWNAWSGGTSEYAFLIALLVANLAGLSLSQAQAMRRLKAVGTILDRSGTLDRFVVADSLATPARLAEHP